MIQCPRHPRSSPLTYDRLSNCGGSGLGSRNFMHICGGGSGAPFEGGSSRGALPTPFEAVSSRGALTGCGGRRTPGGAEGHYPPLMLGSRPSSSRDLALIASFAALV